MTDLRIGNTHIIPSWTRRDLPDAETRARTHNAGQHMSVTDQVIDEHPGPWLLVGDMNGNPDNPLFDKLRRRGFTEHVGRPTRKGEQPDHVWGRGVHVTDLVVIKLSGDHAAIVFTAKVGHLEVRIAVYNLGDRKRLTWRDLNRLRKAGAQVLCLQEALDRRFLITAWRLRHRYRVDWHTNVDGARAIPIVYHRSVPVARNRARLLVPKQHLGNAGNGPAAPEARALTWLHLEDAA